MLSPALSHSFPVTNKAHLLTLLILRQKTHALKLTAFGYGYTLDHKVCRREALIWVIIANYGQY